MRGSRKSPKGFDFLKHFGLGTYWIENAPYVRVLRFYYKALFCETS